jgi:hypothetical protein
MTKLISILEEPKAETYLHLLQFAMRQNSLFSLVWRDQVEFVESAIAVEKALRSGLVKESQTDHWPGTQLLGHVATVRLYRLSLPALSVLAEAKNLYAWVAPDRPEDLAFYLWEDNPWLGSVAHERDAFLYPNSIDLEELFAEVSGLKVNTPNSAG